MTAPAPAQPDRRVVLLISDGAAQLTVPELGVMGREGVSPVIVVVNSGGYIVERAIHGPTAYYIGVVAWNWADLPGALGVAGALTFTVRTVGELAGALVAAADRRDAVIVIEAVVGAADVPPLLAHLAASAATANERG